MIPVEPPQSTPKSPAPAVPAGEADPLVIDDLDRYGRLRLISWWRQERLQSARVLVVGAGALGNEVLKNLALVGLGTIYVIDLDVVEPSNLSRSVFFRSEDGGRSKAEVAARRAGELNPEIRLVPIHGDVITDLGLGAFADVELVIGCLDNREARLWVNRQCWKAGTPWIDAGIQEIQGVVKVFVPPDSACYECAMTERDYQLLNLRYSCPLLRREDIAAGKVPTAPTIASMMGALQVQEALKILHGLPVAAGSAMVYNGVGNQFYSTRLPRREDCLSHETYPAPVELPLSSRSSVAQLFEAARPHVEGPLELVLDRELVVALECPRCEWRGAVMRPRIKVRADEAVCPNCRESARPEFASAVEESSPLADQPLCRVGIPPYDMVRVDGPSGSGFFLLAADRDDWARSHDDGAGSGPVNGDEIVFGEMKVREPERLPRPDRDRKYACLAYEVPAPIDLPIFLDRRTADAIERHALSDTSVELGGILLGKECVDPATGQPFVWVTQSLEAKHYANTQASFTYTHDSWEEITRERDRLHPEFDIVGWYHTHPSFGIFLSHHDLFIHQHFFAQPLQVAYVVDPINQTRGFFQWRDDGLAQVGGYYLTAERGDRISLARLCNDLEKLPNPEGGGGGSLSPRLEAELIKMLTRPMQSPMASPAERLQLATLFGMLGTFFGILGVALALWLFQLQGRVQEQNDNILTLARAVEQLGDNQRLATDTLLRKVAADKPEEFLGQYNKAARDRDENARLLAVQRTISEDEGARARSLADKLQKAENDLAQSKVDIKEMPEMRKRLANIEETLDIKQRQLDELEPYMKKSKEGGIDVDLLQRDLVRTRYGAYAGWGISALLAVGLIAAFFFYKPVLTDDSAPGSPDEDRPTHRIV